ncbi:MAG TPA: ABC transporter substrate-binding protein [Candidatus Azoamicus sp. OHIO2]
MKKILFLIILVISLSVSAHVADPLCFLETVLNEIKPLLIQKNDVYLEKAMDRYIDFEEIALWIVGKTVWTSALMTDKIAFIKELKVLLLKTYKNTIYYYIDADVDFLKPKFDSINQLHKRIQVFSIMKKNNKNITISYRLINNNNSWLVFDIIIEGISILKSLQTQYSHLAKLNGLAYTTDIIKLSLR